jgi:hypothetical protein
MEHARFGNGRIKIVNRYMANTTIGCCRCAALTRMGMYSQEDVTRWFVSGIRKLDLQSVYIKAPGVLVKLNMVAFLQVVVKYCGLVMIA